MLVIYVFVKWLIIQDFIPWILGTQYITFWKSIYGSKIKGIVQILTLL